MVGIGIPTNPIDTFLFEKFLIKVFERVIQRTSSYLNMKRRIEPNSLHCGFSKMICGAVVTWNFRANFAFSCHLNEMAIVSNVNVQWFFFSSLHLSLSINSSIIERFLVSLPIVSLLLFGT